MLLSDEEEWKLWNAQGIDDMNQAEAIAFARAYAAAILTKLGSAELPEPMGYLCDWGNDSYGLTCQTVYYGDPGSAIEDDWNCHPKVHHNTKIFTADQLRQAYAQGAAAQLSAGSVAVTTCDCYPDHGGTIYAEEVLPQGTPLYTRMQE